MAEQKTENKVLPPGAEKPPGDIRRRTKRAVRKGPFVKYVGMAAQREISAADWATLDIELRDKNASHVWGIKNDKLVEADKFSDEQLGYLLLEDKTTAGVHNFLGVDFDKDGNLIQVEI